MSDQDITNAYSRWCDYRVNSALDFKRLELILDEVGVFHFGGRDTDRDSDRGLGFYSRVTHPDTECMRQIEDKLTKRGITFTRDDHLPTIKERSSLGVKYCIVIGITKEFFNGFALRVTGFKPAFSTHNAVLFESKHAALEAMKDILACNFSQLDHFKKSAAVKEVSFCPV